MKQSLQTVFKQAIYNPREDISGAILYSIGLKERRVSRFKVYIYSGAGILSLALLVPAINDLLMQFTKSGFYEYLSLAFSGGSIASYWQEFILSLVDSLPITSLMFSLLLLFVLFISIRRTLHQFKSNLLTA